MSKHLALLLALSACLVGTGLCVTIECYSGVIVDDCDADPAEDWNTVGGGHTITCEGVAPACVSVRIDTEAWFTTQYTCVDNYVVDSGTGIEYPEPPTSGSSCTNRQGLDAELPDFVPAAAAAAAAAKRKPLPGQPRVPPTYYRTVCTCDDGDFCNDDDNGDFCDPPTQGGGASALSTVPPVMGLLSALLYYIGQ